MKIISKYFGVNLSMSNLSYVYVMILGRAYGVFKHSFGLRFNVWPVSDFTPKQNFNRFINELRYKLFN